MSFHSSTEAGVPLFSIIVPAYNVEPYIGMCIESVLAQTWKDFELIVIDDGSKDNTLKICNHYASIDSRISVFHHENGGHTAARNTGLCKSVGAFILFLDSDDWIDSKTLEVCQREIANNKADVVIFGICKHSEDGTKVLENGIPDGVYKLSETGDRIINKLLMSEDGSCVFPKSLSGKVFQREKILHNQLRIPQEVHIGEDGACFVATMLETQIISINSSVKYHYCNRTGSITRTGDKDAMRRYWKLLEYYHHEILCKDPRLRIQFYRFVVEEVYNGIVFVIRSKSDRKWLKSEYNEILSHGIVREGIKEAKFSSKGIKMKVKHLIVRCRLFGLAKLVIKCW